MIEVIVLKYQQIFLNHTMFVGQFKFLYVTD
jgi:hypothetical protein